MTRGFLVLIATIAAFTAAAGTAGGALPPGYAIQRVDSPSPEPNGRFGLGLVNVGDVDGDGAADILTGTDKHGTFVGETAVVSGADGSVVREYAAPEPDDGTGADRKSGFGAAVAKIGDLGSCPSGDADADFFCDDAVVGAVDGVPEHVISASGVDVDAAADDLGVVYVFDGATGALLKRILMPAADRTEQAGLDANDPRFGRTVLWPALDASGWAPPAPALPSAVANGDLNGDGWPELVVGATDYSETGATAHPDSDCATDPGNECEAAGRVYVYSGADIAASDPGDPLETPLATIKNPRSTTDDPAPPHAFANSEGFGELLIPLGDVGTCNSAGLEPGASCSDRTSTADDVPEFVITSPGVDLYGFEEVGLSFEIDGATLATLKTDEPPFIQLTGTAWGGAQNGVVWPALGDAAADTRPDFYVPIIQYNGSHRAQGQGYGVNGTHTANALGFRRIFSILDDPTPHGSEQFGLSAAGIGDVAGDSRGEIMVGAMGPHNPGTNADVVNDVHIFSLLTETALATFSAPDAQGGEAFGIGLAPLGDVNGDDLLDFAVGAGFYDLTDTGDCALQCLNAGRVYVYRSDDAAPSSRIKRPRHGTSWRRAALRQLRGKASDRDGVGVDRVQVALRQRLANGACRWWDGSRFRRGGCASRRWQSARGEESWRYDLSRPLRRSVGTNVRRYDLWSRAIDESGINETDFDRRRNRTSFEVR